MNDKARYLELKDRLKNEGNIDLDLHNTAGFKFPKEYNYILLEYLDTFEDYQYNAMITHCIARSKDRSMIPVLLNEFFSVPHDEYRWYVGDSLYIMGYKDEYFDGYMKIAGNVQYGTSRGMVVMMLGRSKRQEALELLINQMHNWDHGVMFYTLSALKIFKSDPERVYKEVRKFADLLISEKGKEKYIKDMYAGRSHLHIDYTDAEKRRDIQGMYTEVIRHVNAILKRYGGEIPKDQRKLFKKV